MRILRIVHCAGDDLGQHRVTVSLDGEGLISLESTAAFSSTFTQQ